MSGKGPYLSESWTAAQAADYARRIEEQHEDGWWEHDEDWTEPLLAATRRGQQNGEVWKGKKRVRYEALYRWDGKGAPLATGFGELVTEYEGKESRQFADLSSGKVLTYDDNALGEENRR